MPPTGPGRGPRAPPPTSSPHKPVRAPGITPGFKLAAQHLQLSARRPSKGVDELSHLNKGQGVSCWAACPLALPPPLDGSLQRAQYIRGSRVFQCACTLAHRVIHRAEFFPTATCQRHRLRQLALGLARKLERLGGLFVVLPERGHGFFISCCALSCLGFPRLVGGGSLSACRSESPSILLKSNTPAGWSALGPPGRPVVLQMVDDA